VAGRAVCLPVYLVDVKDLMCGLVTSLGSLET
jgi:hypothetical protein